MSYSGRIMNIPTGEDIEDRDNFSGKERIIYKVGHRDARHAAAEIAMEADQRTTELEQRVEKLERILEEALEILSHDQIIERRTSRLLHEQYMEV